MSVKSTGIANVFRGDRLTREIDEELQSHIEEAIDQGRDPAEVRRAFGSALRQREETQDVRIISWLDSLRADTVFGFRRLRKSKVTSAAAILSLALAIGACTSAFRLIDALLLRNTVLSGRTCRAISTRCPATASTSMASRVPSIAGRLRFSIPDARRR